MWATLARLSSSLLPSARVLVRRLATLSLSLSHTQTQCRGVCDVDDVIQNRSNHRLPRFFSPDKTAQLVIISNNTPPLRKSEIEYYAMLAKTGVHHYTGSTSSFDLVDR